jgi:hypothetical protein
MFENFTKKEKSPNDELGEKLFQRIWNAVKPKESEEEKRLRKLKELTELSKWMNGVTRSEVEQRLSSLQNELMEFYQNQKGKIKNEFNPQEDELRKKIKMLDGHLQNHQI